MGGAGYQAALGETAFDVLKKRLGVGCEAFASPLNCRYGRFCSAFPDVDGAFGSLGSFFEFKPQRGSFEMNPPFVPETLLKAAEHAETLLDAAEEAGGRLSFVVVVPAWRDTQMWTALEGSKHVRGDILVVPAAEHGFCDGAQHCRPPAERHRVSSYDTGVFFLQTTNGARRWPVTDEVRAELKAAMKDAVGSAKSVKELETRYRGKPEQRLDRPGDRPVLAPPREKLRIERRDDAVEENERAADDGGEGGEKKRRRRRRKHD
jgi:phosphorylated CTD-interacting factor 1